MNGSRAAWWGLAVIGVAVLLSPLVFPNPYQIRLGSLLLAYALLAVALDLVVGRTGQISLGHAAFFAIGAYGEGMLQAEYHVAPWAALALAVVMSAVCGVVVAGLAQRVRGPYLAMLTIGVGIAVQNAIYVAQPFTQGAMGLAGIGGLPLPFAAPGPVTTYYVGAVALLLALAGGIALSSTRIGTAMAVLRQRETLARAAGIDVRRVKIAAFTASAALAAAAGAFYGTTLGFISPESFSMKLSIFALVSCVLGGLGTPFGPLLGTALLYGFQQIAARTAQGDVLMFGVLLIVVPLLLSRGLAGVFVSLSARIVAALGLQAPRAQATLAAAARPGDKATAVLWLPRRDGERFHLREISHAFGALRALSGVSLEVAPGEVVGIVGPNGAGKTTLLNIASGYYRPSSGMVLLGVTDLTRVPMHERARMGVVPTFQHPQLMDASTVLANVEAGLLADPRAASAKVGRLRLDDVAADLGLTPLLGMLAGDLPYGPRKIVEVARALVSEPAVLLLDEPTSGIAPADVEMVANAIRIARERGVAVVLADHRVEFVTQVCDRVVVLVGGAQLAAGRPAEVTANPAVVEAYLGRPSQGNYA
ncbi:MAG TPA: branched-chain amino acid ABC transporter ATP-binding protein/permease [Candidatus Dormibacteraeota bacterium]|nr:branched-chain amino acid ABC transporter ATP-binding protein/permease [Candidatus Dormibacteraeota bacterium]